MDSTQEGNIEILGAIEGRIQKPAWLEALYREKFFVGCSTHESAKKNEKNILCLDCCISICPHCLSSHRFHRLVQIRRYVYHDVVRLEDLEKLIDCSNVQAYTINSAKVVFIKKRPQSRQFKGTGNYCTSCDRCLQEPYIHCSLGCKVEFAMKHNNKDLSPYLRNCKMLQLSPDFMIPQDCSAGGDDDDDDEMTNETPHSSVVDCEEEAMMMSSSSGSSSGGCETIISNSNSNMVVVVCSSEFVRKKKRSTTTSSGLYVCGRSGSRVSDEEDMATSMISRRKGIPHRSPMC
ncbi:protein RGF1 INDUCIBLE TRANSCRIPTION FACTOR 1-like [Telopea speciosissima]|uniref:protein RGF1 INDUCIBLE TRANSCRIPTION FACTOR 1-like n=1 Tax=Telopea speciosissima TaxID=54955 RepID=UPI001CC44EEF|nr:protein RGF1 INDUCIBLE TRANSCRIPTION FACTOR 1-like [Telopea speciosissima]